jgi:hypothetical protein
VAILRRAFDATMADRAFRNEAAGMGFDVAPKTGEAITALVAEALATPKDIAEGRALRQAGLGQGSRPRIQCRAPPSPYAVGPRATARCTADFRIMPWQAHRR